MKNDIVAQFLLGFFIALANAIINLAVNGQINWLWVGTTFLISFALIFTYQGTGVGKKFYSVWKIGKGELITSGGVEKDGVWEFDKSNIANDKGFYGPYIPLTAGKYRCVFRLKIDKSSREDKVVCELDVLLNQAKLAAFRSLSNRDFKHSDKWQDVSIDFNLYNDENRVEFRFRVKNIVEANRRISFDKVTVYKRLV